MRATIVIAAAARIHAAVRATIATAAAAGIHATVIVAIAITAVASRMMAIKIYMVTIALDAATTTATTCSITMSFIMAASVTYYAMHVVTSQTTIPNRTAIAIEAVAIVAATVSAIIGNPYRRTAIVEVTAIVVAVDGEVPTTCTPSYRAEEIIGCHQEIVLPVVQDAAEVVETIRVVVAIEIGGSVDTKEVVEVDLIGVVILLVVEVELIGHLIGQVESLCLCTLETHCAGTHPGCHHDYEGEKELFHSCIFLCCLTMRFLIHTAKVRQ